MRLWRWGSYTQPHPATPSPGYFVECFKFLFTLTRTAGGKGGLVQSSAPGSGGKLNPNLTQPNAAASVFGFTAPRMSNAFARRHGLNPKDNPMLNLQKIALQSQQQQQAPQVWPLWGKVDGKGGP